MSKGSQEKAQKKKFLKRGFLFLVLFSGLHYLLVFWFEYAIMSQDFFMWRWKHQVATRENNAGQTDYEVLWIGDSRVLGAIDPTFLTQHTQKTMVNLAGGGMQFPAMYYLLKRYLQHHRAPEIIFLSQAPYAWNSHPEFLEHQLKFVATFSEYCELCRTLPSRYWGLLLQYPLFCLKSAYAFNPEFRGSFFKRGAHNRQVEHLMQQQLGFRAWSNRQLQEKDSLELHWKFEPDSANLLYLEKILQLSQSSKIRVVFMTMPFPQSRYEGLEVENAHFLVQYENTLKALQEKYSFELSNTRDILPDIYFADFSHVNEQGARFYGEFLLPRLQTYFSKK